MICAVFGENRVTLRGHAGYAPPGEDIVCAAASALVFALIGALEEKGLLRELVDQCQQEGSIHPSHDPDEVVEDLVVLHRGTLFEWRIYREGFDVARQGRRMADALVRGLQTE